MSDAEKFSFYRRTSFVPIKYDRWNDHASLLRTQGSDTPRLLASAPLNAFKLTVVSVNPMGGYSNIEYERQAELAILWVVGSAFTLLTYAFLSRKRSRHLAIESEARTRLILESANCGIWGQSGDGRCTFINTEAARLLGYESHEILGKEIHTLVHHTHEDGRPFPHQECPARSTCMDG